MNANQFANLTAKHANLITRYIADESPGMVIRKVLRFIDGNFRAQGWQGASFQPWKPLVYRKGTILVKTGALRRGMNYANLSKGTVRFYNNMPYGLYHNEGYSGPIHVPGHTRSFYVKAKASALYEFDKKGRHKVKTVTNKTGETTVKAYTKYVNIPERQFAPYEGSESPVLNASILRELEREIKKILTF